MTLNAAIEGSTSLLGQVANPAVRALVLAGGAALGLAVFRVKAHFPEAAHMDGGPLRGAGSAFARVDAAAAVCAYACFSAARTYCAHPGRANFCGRRNPTDFVVAQDQPRAAAHCNAGLGAAGGASFGSTAFILEDHSMEPCRELHLSRRCCASSRALCRGAGFQSPADAGVAHNSRPARDCEACLPRLRMRTLLRSASCRVRIHFGAGHDGRTAVHDPAARGMAGMG